MGASSWPMVPDSGALDAPAVPELAAMVGELVGSLGDSQFYSGLFEQLYRLFPAEHVYLFRQTGDQPGVLHTSSRDGSEHALEHATLYDERRLWRHDRPATATGVTPCGHARIINDYLPGAPSAQLRSFGLQARVASRTAFLGLGSAEGVGLSIAWPLAWGRSNAYRSAMDGVIDLILPILRKHVAVCENRSKLAENVSSLALIERRLQSVIAASRRREVDVGARLLFGMSAAAVAADLAIGKETVISHRKRIYEHFNVGNSREFMFWYLSREWPGQRS